MYTRDKSFQTRAGNPRKMIIIEFNIVTQKWLTLINETTYKTTIGNEWIFQNIYLKVYIATLSCVGSYKLHQTPTYLYSLVLARFKNGDIIESPKADSESFVMDDLTTNDAGTYTCRVENEFGAVYSEPATLSVMGKVVFLLYGKPELLILKIYNYSCNFFKSVFLFVMLLFV